MNWKTLAIVFFALASFGLYGCNDTAAGMAEDTQENAQAVAEKSEEVAEDAREAADDVVEAGEDAAAATNLTTRIAAQFATNAVLNDPGVDINVDSTAENVTLKGHVANAEQKDMAEKIAKETIEEAGSGQKLVNELEVRGS